MLSSPHPGVIFLWQRAKIFKSMKLGQDIILCRPFSFSNTRNCHCISVFVLSSVTVFKTWLEISRMGCPCLFHTKLRDLTKQYPSRETARCVSKAQYCCWVMGGVHFRWKSWTKGSMVSTRALYGKLSIWVGATNSVAREMFHSRFHSIRERQILVLAFIF